MTAKAVHIGRWRNNVLAGTLCGSPRWESEGPASKATCKRCIAAWERCRVSIARSNTESSAGRIPRTPGR